LARRHNCVKIEIYDILVRNITFLAIDIVTKPHVYETARRPLRASRARLLRGTSICQILLTELTVLTLEVNTNGIELILQYRIVAGLEMLSDFEFSLWGGAPASY
jgi:hypothetical protein